MKLGLVLVFILFEYDIRNGCQGYPSPVKLPCNLPKSCIDRLKTAYVWLKGSKYKNTLTNIASMKRAVKEMKGACQKKKRTKNEKAPDFTNNPDIIGKKLIHVIRLRIQCTRLTELTQCFKSIEKCPASS